MRGTACPETSGKQSHKYLYKYKIENVFRELKDNSVLRVFLEKREVVIEKKEQLLKIFSECKTLLEILNNIDSLNDLDLIK